MDEEGMINDIAEARGVGVANNCLMAAIVATLVTKGILTGDDTATLTGTAKTAIDRISEDDLPADAREMANAALRGFATAWLRLVTRKSLTQKRLPPFSTVTERFGIEYRPVRPVAARTA
ncbi:MAG: hypothetical protein WA459_18060, partial [Stellaceae bacterium]